MGTETNGDDLDWRSVCSITSGLDVLGDKWSLLIIRDLIAPERGRTPSSVSRPNMSPPTSSPPGFGS